MSLNSLMNPKSVQYGRSELRQNQNSVLRQARGNTVILVTSNSEGEEKYVVDKEYFDKVLTLLQSAAETLEITSDRKLFSRLLDVSKTIDEDIRLGKLHSFEEAFGDNEEA
jgi:hypothetical protein